MTKETKDLGAAPPRSRKCPRCVERGKTWKGDNPTCAFPDLGEFSVENWMCATMNALRDLVDGTDGEGAVYSEDQYAAVLPDDGAFLVLGWYKRRGRTEFAAMLSGEAMNPFRHEDAVRILGRERAALAAPPASAALLEARRLLGEALGRMCEPGMRQKIAAFLRSDSERSEPARSASGGSKVVRDPSEEGR